MKRLLLALALLLPVHVYAAGILMGPMSSGSPQGGGGGTAPVVTATACTVAPPVTGFPVALAGGGTCQYTATCGGVACADINSITAWAISAQSTVNGFAISSSGVLQGGSAAASVPAGASTVTVNATNAAGASPDVVQNLTVIAPPVVAALSCTVQSPITTGVNVTKQGGGTCQYTATCAGGACSGAGAITGWAITASTCTNCYALTAAGVVQGGTAAATVGNRSDTLTVTASNAGGTSPAKVQPIAAVTVPVVNNQNFTSSLPLSTGKVIGTMTATPVPASWAITAATGNNASTADFAVSNAGVITATASAATDITTPGLSTITLTATNATGTSAPGTATVTLPSTGGPTLQVATNTQFGNTLSAFAQGMCRIAHYTRAGITTSQAVYPGWYVNPLNTGNYGTETSTGNYTVSRWIEYPAGTYTQVDNAIPVTGGTNTVGGIGNVSIPANTQFYEWYLLSGGTWPYLATGQAVLATALGEACNMGAVASPATPGVSITDNGSFLRWAGPVAIIGPNSKSVAVLITGDSRTIGVHDVADATTNRGNLARSIGPTYDYINAAVSGADSSEYLSGGVNQKALQQYVTHVVNEYGINFFLNRNMSNASAWPFEARMQATFNGKHYVGTTLEPHTSSTDSWATDANQTILTPADQAWNANRQGQSPFVDLLTPVQSPTANNKWLNNGSANTYTVDGVHESVGGYAQVATAASSIITAINAAPIVAATQPTVNLTQGGTVTYDTAAPKFGGSALSGGFGSNMGSFPGTVPATMECWYKAPANPGGFYLFGQGNDGTGAFPNPAVIVSGSTLQYRYNGGPTATANTVADGTWHHLAFVLQPGSFQLYDNGVQAASGSISLSQAPFAVSGFEVKFNGNTVTPSVTNGELDECAVWNTAKYTGNFTPPTNAYNGNEAGLVMLYHFDGNMNGLSTLYNQTTNGIPIVNSNGGAPCTASLPVTTGQTICTLTANNTPTTWSVSSQSCANGFAINNSGVLLGGSGAASLSAGTCTVSVQASNVNGASSAQAESVVLSGGSLPAGVSLRAIDGETMTGLVQSHNFYSSHGHSKAVSMGWDGPGFFPVGPFLSDYNSGASAYAGKTNAQVWTDVGWNTMFAINSWDTALALTNGVSGIIQADASAVTGARPLPYVGILNQDEPHQFNPSPAAYSSIRTPITGTANSISDSLFFYVNYDWHWVDGQGLSGAPAPNTPTSISATTFATPNASLRHLDHQSIDMYFFSEIQWGFMTGSGGAGSQIYGIVMTDAQARRGTNYGDMIDIQRSFQAGNFPAPIFQVVEDGNPFDGSSVANWITPPQYDQTLWASIIHGTRAFCIFDHNFGGNASAAVLVEDTANAMSTIRAGQTISMYNQMKATQNRIQNMAPIINAPFAIGYASAATVRYNYPGSQAPGTPTPIGNGVDMATHWYQGGSFTNASGTFTNGFYVFVTPSNATTDTNISATFTVKSGATATVVGESRSIPIVAGAFSDTFAKATTVHIYQIN